MATHSSTLAWTIPFRRAWQDTAHRVAESTEQQREPHIEHGSTGPPAPHAPSVPSRTPSRGSGGLAHTRASPSQLSGGRALRRGPQSGLGVMQVGRSGSQDPERRLSAPVTQPLGSSPPTCGQGLLSPRPAGSISCPTSPQSLVCPFYKQTHILQVNRLHLHTHTSTHRHPTLWLGILGRRQEENQPPPSR